MDIPATRVLLVEDNEDDYLIVRDLLSDISGQEFDIEWVEDVELARQALSLGAYDVCLVDHRLAGRNGLSLVEEQILGDPPFILLSGQEDREVDVAATKAGAMDYLQKGHINGPLLERSIRYAIERAKREATLAKREATLQAALRQSHLLSTVITNLTDGMVITDARKDDFPIVFSNPGFSAITGYSQEEVLGRNCRFLQGAETDPQTVREMREAIAEKRPFQGVVRNYRKDGTPFWNGVKVTPVFDDEGQLINFMGLLADITERRQSEIALRESEANLARAQHIARIGSWELDLSSLSNVSSNSLRWSDENFRLFGFEPGQVEVTNENFFCAVHPDDRDRVAAAMASALGGGEPYDIEHRVIWADGSEHAIHGQANLVLDKVSGLPLKMVGTGQDITERKRAEAKVHFQKALLEAQTEASLDGILVVSGGASGEKKVLSYNQRLVQMWNIPPEVTASDDEAAFRKVILNQVVNSEEVWDRATSIYENPTEQTREEVLLCNGRVFDRYSAPIADAMGAYYGRVWYFRDITEAKLAEAALMRMRNELEVRVEERTAELKQANAETRMRARQQEAVAELGHRALTDVDMDILLNGAVALVTATLDVEVGTILELVAQDSAFRIRASTGYEIDESLYRVPLNLGSQAGYALLSKAPTIVTHLPTESRFTPSSLLLDCGIVSGITVTVGGYAQPFGTLGAHTTQQRTFTQDDVNFLEAVANVLAAAIERHKVETEIRQLNTQLKETNEQLRVENIERQNALSALRESSVGLERAKVEAEEAREHAEVANRAKSEFLSRMSHELRTPLNAVLGFGQILEMRNRKADAQQQDNIQQILKGGRHLLGLINEVLDISRVEAGGAELSLDPIFLYDVVPEACELVRPLAAQRGIRLEHDLAAWGEIHVIADRQRLKQVLLNLLANAIKYNRPAGEVVVFCETKPDGRIRIGVRDSGPGIAAADIPKLFTPFERLNAASTCVEGTGLGLVLSQRLVTAMGGTLTLESVLGQGSTFVVELAQAPAPEQSLRNSAAVDSQMARKGPTQRQCSVLCIEDNPSNLRLFEVILQSRSEVTLLPAMQGSVGLDLARQHRPDLILLDLHLPDMSGQEVLGHLKRSEATREIPVIVISADATDRQINQLKEAGARAYLTKPLDVAQFLVLVDEVLEARRTP